MKSVYKKIAYIIVLVLLFSTFLQVPNISASQKVKINKTKVTLRVGKTCKLKLKNNKRKIKWTSSKKKVATVSKKGNVKAKKPGKAVITAKVGNKKFKCRVTVKKKKIEWGSRKKPLSAYEKYKDIIYDYGTLLGKFSIELLDYKDGREAFSYLKSFDKYDLLDYPGNNQEYIYFRFRIEYLEGTKQVDAHEVFNYYSNIFNSSRTLALENLDWDYPENGIEDMVNVSMYPGAVVECQKAILVRGGNTPVCYRLQTEENGYTWFTTKR